MRNMPRPRRATTVPRAGASDAQDRVSTPSPVLQAGSAETLTDYSSVVICQGDGRRPGSAFSHAVLLANFDPSIHESLELTLRKCRYKVLRPEAEGISLDDVTDDELHQVDFVVFNLTNRSDETWRRFRRMCSVRKMDGMPLLVQGWSRKFHGARFHNDVEMLGARMEYGK
jgi:hypothetical protein